MRKNQPQEKSGPLDSKSQWWRPCYTSRTAVFLGIIIAFVFTVKSGVSLLDGFAKRQALLLTQQARAIIIAAEKFNAQKDRWPHNLAELARDGGLEWASALKIGVTLASSNLEGKALLNSKEKGWGQLLFGEPLYATSRSIPFQMCREFNLINIGNDGILKQPHVNFQTQCFGDGPFYQLVTRAASSIDKNKWMKINIDNVKIEDIRTMCLSPELWQVYPDAGICADR